MYVYMCIILTFFNRNVFGDKNHRCLSLYRKVTIEDCERSLPTFKPDTGGHDYSSITTSRHFEMNTM